MGTAEMRPPRFPGGAAFERYDAVVFDCDGVLLDSNDLKIEAFRRVLIEAGLDSEVVSAFSAMQTRSFGTSRHRLFDRLLSGEFGRVPPAVTKAHLLDAFGQAVASGYLEVAETEGMAALLDQWSGRVPFFVVSGSDELELVEVFRARGLDRAFLGIFGSPATKIDNLSKVKDIVRGFGIAEPNLLFLGDAEADADAAHAQQADFVFVARYSKVRESMTRRGTESERFFQIEALSDLLVAAETAAP